MNNLEILKKTFENVAECEIFNEENDSFEVQVKLQGFIYPHLIWKEFTEDFDDVDNLKNNLRAEFNFDNLLDSEESAYLSYMLNELLKEQYTYGVYENDIKKILNDWNTSRGRIIDSWETFKENVECELDYVLESNENNELVGQVSWNCNLDFDSFISECAEANNVTDLEIMNELKKELGDFDKVEKYTIKNDWYLVLTTNDRLIILNKIC